MPIFGFYVRFSGVVWDLLVTQQWLIHLDRVYFGTIAGDLFQFTNLSFHNIQNLGVWFAGEYGSEDTQIRDQVIA